MVECKAGSETLRATDHKTGKVPGLAPKQIGRGEHLQPLLYALAAETLFNAPVESGRLFYCTHRGRFQTITVDLSRNARKAVQLVALTINQAIRSGFLPAAPAERACEYCDYRLICGPYEPIRSSRKDRSRLEELEELRRMP
jgi:CRISPR/Cas system-associated exonuclease Cas4 (RecB family)